ncbi:hypothetical protein OIU84_014709 [Salix udensis]|uniref:Uncharacterized protein n=1 Tax=Salix udensis TaxID=889485 RepID=A0AAD6NRB7_9ROSI|nr:hypothetical protein OIU84_014709 [Salix udensis]
MCCYSSSLEKGRESTKVFVALAVVIDPEQVHIMNQLVLNLEYGLFSATENHFCCTASYLELEPLSCRYKWFSCSAPAVEFNVVELKTKRAVNAMKM